MDSARKTLARGPLTLAIVSLGLLTSSQAAAESPDYDDSDSSAGRDIHSPLNPVAVEALMTLGGGDAFGFGLGARLSYTLESGVFLGGAFTHYLGSSVAVYGMESSWSADKAMLEGGYEFWWDKIGLRPYAGLGMVFVRSSTTIGAFGGSAVPATESSDSAVAVALGAQFTYAMSEAFYLGADGYFLNGFDEMTDSSLQIAGRVGTSF